MDAALLDAEIFRVASVTGAVPRAKDEEPRPFECRRIVVAVQPSPGTTELSWARRFAQRFDADVTLVNVSIDFAAHVYAAGIHAPAVGPTPYAMRLPAKDLEAARAFLEEAAAELGDLPRPPRTVSRAGSHVGDEIVKAAEEAEADLIIVGQGTRGIDRILIGSTADFVKDHATTNVLIAKRPPGRGDVLLPVDGSRHSRAAGRAAYEIARRMDRSVDLLHVVPPGWTETETGRSEPPDEVARPSVVPGVTTRVRSGDPRDVIVDTAREQDHDLIVMGTRGLSGIRRLFLGSVSNYVSHAAGTSLLLVRGD